MEENNQTDKTQVTDYRQSDVDHTAKPVTSPFRVAQKASAWAMIICAILFAIIAILAIWGVFGDNSNFVWQSLSTLAVITFCSLVINVGSKIYDNTKNK